MYLIFEKDKLKTLNRVGIKILINTMESKINYIRNLVYLGLVDNEFHEKEKEFIRNVGARLGLNTYEIENEINSVINENPCHQMKQPFGLFCLMI